MGVRGYTRESSITAVSKGEANLISYGRLFISNLDLPLRFEMGTRRLNKYDRSTFYILDHVVGYTYYRFL